jgi:hypothetical protein
MMMMIIIFVHIAHSMHCEFIYKLFGYRQMHRYTILYFNPYWHQHVKPKHIEANYI